MMTKDDDESLMRLFRDANPKATETELRAQILAASRHASFAVYPDIARKIGPKEILEALEVLGDKDLFKAAKARIEASPYLTPEAKSQIFAKWNRRA